MLKFLRKRLEENEEGFTLIELMVVVLIIGILVAIAIPTFLGAQNRARDRGAQSDLRNAVTAAKTIATDAAGEFTNVNVAALQQAEGALTFGTTPAANSITVASATPASDGVLLYTQSASNTWFGIRATSAGQVTYCRGTAATDVSNYGTCNRTSFNEGAPAATTPTTAAP